MSRRVVIAIVVVLALVGARLLVSRGIRPVRAARAGVERANPARPAETPEAVATETSPAAVPGASSEMAPEKASELQPEAASGATSPAVLAQNGITDIDPHKAFGSKSAPIVMEIFSDYQCPSCKALYENTNRQLMENYVSTGKVYLIHRDFPLPMHAYSKVAARYARAAAELGKIEPVEKALYDNQEKWEQNGDVDGILAGVLSTAEMTKVRGLVKGGTLDPLIDKDTQAGQMYRVNQTPTTVFHSKGQTYPYSGAMSYDILHQFLDQLLNQK